MTDDVRGVHQAQICFIPDSAGFGWPQPCHKTLNSSWVASMLQSLQIAKLETQSWVLALQDTGCRMEATSLKPRCGMKTRRRKPWAASRSQTAGGCNTIDVCRAIIGYELLMCSAISSCSCPTVSMSPRNDTNLNQKHRNIKPKSLTPNPEALYTV